jgi:hypothetical protein
VTEPEFGDPVGKETDPADARASLEGKRLAGLLKPRDLDASPAEGVSPLLAGVQRKIRQRSRGKFYGDRWSTSQLTLSYVPIAIAMLVVLGLAYLVLGPVVGAQR